MAEAKSKQNARRAKSTAAMLEAAVDLVGEGGVEALTLAAIGERSGYSRGLVTSRFGSKDGLLDALIDKVAKAWMVELVDRREQAGTGLSDALESLEFVWSVPPSPESDRRMRALNMLMFEAVGPEEVLHERARSIHRTMRRQIAAAIGRGIEDGSIRATVDAEMEAALIVGGLRGIGYQWQLDPDAIDTAELLKALYEATRQRLVITPAS